MDRQHSRRHFVQGLSVAGLALVAGCGRLPGQAQARGSPPRLGAMVRAAPEGAASAAFLDRLHALGYVEGQNILIEWRAPGPQADPADLVQALVQLPVDILYVSGTRAALAGKQATSTLPVVVTALRHPVRLGGAATPAHPGRHALWVA